MEINFKQISNKLHRITVFASQASKKNPDLCLSIYYFVLHFLLIEKHIQNLGQLPCTNFKIRKPKSRIF